MLIAYLFEIKMSIENKKFNPVVKIVKVFKKEMKYAA